MTELVLVFAFILVGVITGIASGLLGIGGGIIFVPSLFFLLPFLNVDHSLLPIVVIATSLFAGSFASSSAFYSHFKKSNIDFKAALLLASGSIPAAFVTPYFIVDFDPFTLKIILSLILFIVAVKMMFEKKEEVVNGLDLKQIWLIPFGIFTGVLSALSGLGGGVVFVPILVYLFNFDIRKAIGSSTMVVAATMISSTISFGLASVAPEKLVHSIGYINLLAGVSLGIGALFSARLGVKFVFNYSLFAIKKIFSLFLILFIIKLLFL